MNKTMKLTFASVRMKLAVTAAAGLILLALMTILVLQTTHAAQDVVTEAQSSHERLRVFARLQTSGNLLQSLTYEAVRVDDEEKSRALQAARADFADALSRVGNLPQRTPAERETIRRVEDQGRAVLELFDQGRAIVAAVDEQWRARGSKAALEEIQKLSEPYKTFVKMVHTEIARGDDELARSTRRAMALQRTAGRVAVAGLALGLGISISIFIVLMTRLGPGLKRLEQGARAFGAGDLAHRVSLQGRDELAQLATSFNSMAQELSEQQAALHQVQAGLEKAVASRTAELEKANTALSEEDGRRRAFLADASHELRIPLTIIRGEAQVAMRNSERGTVDAIEVFSHILEQTRHLTRLLDDLFLIARAEAGGLRLNLIELDLADLVCRVANDFSTIACESGATVRARASGPLLVVADPDRIRQALAALIDNAMRHTRAGVNILVEARREHNTIAISVADDGPGVDPSLASELFGRFKRGPGRGEGSGLGLTVVRALTEAHGGTATLVNGANGGARATLQLPAGLISRRAVA
jgi:two-component system, OmpR family, sensor kinase